MLEVKIVSYEDLTEVEQEGQPDNGNGKDYADYLKITHNGHTIVIHSDAMEPEDVTFGRDLSWVSDAIKTAYELGKKDN